MSWFITVEIIDAWKLICYGYNAPMHIYKLFNCDESFYTMERSTYVYKRAFLLLLVRVIDASCQVIRNRGISNKQNKKPFNYYLSFFFLFAGDLRCEAAWVGGEEERRRGGGGFWGGWFWMLGVAEVAREAPPQGTGLDAGPRIASPHADLHPRTKGGVEYAIYRRRVALVPWQRWQNGRSHAVLTGTGAITVFQIFFPSRNRVISDIEKFWFKRIEWKMASEINIVCIIYERAQQIFLSKICHLLAYSGRNTN